MQEHVGYQRPWLPEDRWQISRQFEPVDKPCFPSGKKESNPDQFKQKKNGKIDINQPGYNRAVAKRGFYLVPDFHTPVIDSMNPIVVKNALIK